MNPRVVNQSVTLCRYRCLTQFVSQQEPFSQCFNWIDHLDKSRFIIYKETLHFNRLLSLLIRTHRVQSMPILVRHWINTRAINHENTELKFTYDSIAKRTLEMFKEVKDILVNYNNTIILKIYLKAKLIGTKKKSLWNKRFPFSNAKIIKMIYTITI